MKIRFEKVEIEIPREFVDTIGNGFLRLKQFDAEAQSRESVARQSLVQSVMLTAIHMFRESVNRPAPKSTAQAGATDAGMHPVAQDNAEHNGGDQPA